MQTAYLSSARACGCQQLAGTARLTQVCYRQTHLQHRIFQRLICITLRAAAGCFVKAKECFLELVDVQINGTSLPATQQSWADG